MSAQQDFMKYYSINLPELRALCLKKSVKGVTKKSNRQQMINALIKHDKTKTNKNKPLQRRRSLPKHTPKSPIPNRNRPNTNSSNRRSRKRSRKDLDEDTQANQPSDDELRNKKRRKTNTPSTMTTPERNRNRNENVSQSPIRNPRIIPNNIQKSLHKAGYTAPIPYQSRDLIDLLNDSDSSEEDSKIKDKKPVNNKLTLMKASSPEDSDDESQSQSPSPKPKTISFYANNNESDSDSDNSASESESSNFDDGLTYNNNNKYVDDTKSPSRSRPSILTSNTNHIISNVPKPAIYTRYNVTPQIPINNYKSQPKPQQYIASNLNRMPVNVNSPFPMQHPPSHIQNMTEVDNELNLQDDINRIIPEHRSTSPVFDTIKNVTYYIKLPFVKIYQLIRFILRYWKAFSIIIIVIALLGPLLYSPTVKIMKSIDWKYVTTNILQNLNILPRVKYCNSGDLNADEYDCTPCPDNAKCYGGDLYCQGDRRFIKGKCMYDKQEIAKLKSQMLSYSKTLLSQRCGEYICQKYYIYNYIYSIDEKGFKIDNKALSEEELSKQLATALQVSPESHLFDQVFTKFITSIKDPKNKTIKLGIKYDDETQSYSSGRESKGIGCYAIMFVTDNCLWVIPMVICGNVFVIWWIRRVMKRNKILRNKQIAMDRKEDVICILKNFQNNSNQRWIPTVQIKAQIMRDSNSKEEWDRVERLVDRDANIQKSAQIVDGLQKLCWKLSDTALID